MKTLKNKFVNIDEQDELSVLETLRAKQLSGTATIVEEYEKDLARYFGKKYALACSNGTVAIHLALLALNIKENDEIIVPPTAPVMTVLPILLAKAIPVFADTISNNNFGYDLGDLKNKITPKTKVIITVPMWGYPVEMESLIKLAQKLNIPVVEDCSQAHGTKVNNKFLGTYGLLGLWSTHDRKLIATGEGAFIVTNDFILYQKMQEIKSFGRVIRDSGKLHKYNGQFGVLFGLNYKISAIGAALGISQLKKLEQKISQRTQNANYIKNGLKNLNWIREIPIITNGTPNYYAMVLQIDKKFRSVQRLSEILKDKMIISDTYEYNYRPLYKMPLFKKYVNVCDNAADLTKTIITLPTHEGLSKEDLNYMIKTLNSIS